MSDNAILRAVLLFVTAFVTAAISCQWSAALQKPESPASNWQVDLCHRVETGPGSGRYHRITRQEVWEPARTAIIVCDMWDAHHSLNATRRVNELAPQIDRVLKAARERNATIIHAPSDCMESYADHPARKRAGEMILSANIPEAVKQWCSRVASEEPVTYPLDQADGGDDDDPTEHAKWAEELKAQGRNPGSPWKMQSPLIEIDSDRDFISEFGGEIWSILESRGIDNVILCGVHTNMCVLGRPFGLRNMVTAGKRVALLRDLTDTMYNPNSWPYVSHYTGTGLIVEYIEKVICPTITSDQLAGGDTFRFSDDKRPLVAIVMAEDEYETNRTLPRFATEYLGHDFRVELLYSSDDDPNVIPGLELLELTDALIVSVRRRPLSPSQMKTLRKFVDAGKPVVGIRTASHAFLVRDAEPPDGLTEWTDFDATVFGGNYSGHHGNTLLPTIRQVPEKAGHAILKGVELDGMISGGSLYKTSPLASSAEVLLAGSIPNQPIEPVAWVFARSDGGNSFYTSLGQKQDFENPGFKRMLFNSLLWATGQGAKEPPGRSALTDRSDDN